MKKVTTSKNVKAAQVVGVNLELADPVILLDDNQSVNLSELKNNGAGCPTNGDYVIDYQREDGSNKYIAWCPKDIHEESVNAAGIVSIGSFSWALMRLKEGAKIARRGWNGKGMWLLLVPGSPNIRPVAGTPYSNAGITQEVNIDAHVDMFTACGSMQPGWMASQNDMLAEDWEESE